MPINTRNAPPKDVPPSELWTRLTELPRPVSARHQFVARNNEVGEIVFWVLTAGELSQARMRADKETRASLDTEVRAGNLAYEEEYEQQKAYQVLALAARQPNDVIFPAFPRASEVRDKLTDDEITAALAAYNIFRRESAPVIDEMTQPEMEAWISVLKEGASRFPLAACSGANLTDLVMYLVSKLPPADSSTATSSAGSPPDESSTTSE